MKNFFAGILIYLFAFNLAIAMDSYEGPTIDSLQKLLNNTLSEEDRFSVLNQLSRAYHPLEPTVARTYNNQAKALIETFDNPAYPKAITDLQEGRILIAERNMQSAIEVIQKAQNTALELDDQRLIAQCIQEIGYAHMLLSNYEQSEKLINQSLLLGRQLNDDRIIAENKSNLARIFDVQGDFNKALLNNFEALDIYKAIKDDYQITRSYNNIAIIYQHQGDYDKALEYYNRALEAAQKSNLIKLASYMYHNIGTIYVLRQEYSKAIDLYLNAADDFRRYKDTISLGQAYENIGDILVDIKQFEQSEQYFKQAEQLYSLKDDSLSIADVYLNLGNLYKEQNNGEKAMVFNDKALNLFLKYNAKPSVAIAQTQQAYCYLNEGQIDKARSYFNRSLTIAKEVSDSARIAENFLGISSILLKQKPIPDEVFDLSFQAYGWAVRADAVLAQKKALENLSVAYEEKGEYDKAFQYFKEFKAISDKLLNEENVQRITGAKQELELQAQQESERILRNQVKLRTTIQNVLAILLITLVIGLATIIYQFQSKKEAYKQLEEKNKLITEQSALVRQNKQELEEQALRLKDLNTTKDKLFAIISHDLKSPIGRLEGILQLISDQYIDQSTFNTFAQDLKASTEQVHATLDNLLRWSYSQLNGFELSPKYFYAYYEVDKVAQFLSETAKAKNIKIVNKIPDTAQLYADPESFKLIMRNLISNAIKFSESYTTINLESGIHNGHQIIKVIDQGIGMTDQQQKNLFKMGSESLRGTQGERGLGIGLSLSQEMAEKNHGYIQAESNPAQGSTFSLFLPYDVVN